MKKQRRESNSKKILLVGLMLLIGVFMVSFSSAEYYVDIYADSVTGSIGSVVVTDLGTGVFRVNATDGNYEVDRALVMKWLFYGTDGTNPRATSTYITNPTYVLTNDTRDIGKSGYYTSEYVASGTFDKIYTFDSIVNNENVSGWSYLHVPDHMSTGKVLRYQLNGITKNQVFELGTSDETGLDKSLDEENNPTTLRIYTDGAGDSKTSKVFWLSSPTGSWNTLPDTFTDFYINESFPIFTAPPNITLNNPEDNYANIIYDNIIFNITSTSDSSRHLSNITLYINDTLNETKSLSGTEDIETFTKSFSTLGAYNWSVIVCDNESICTTSETRDFTVANYRVESITINSTAYETSTQTYSINITPLSSSLLTAVKLVLNGTEYTATQSGTVWSKSMDIPHSIVGDQTPYFKITYNGVNYNSDTTNQTILPINLTYCTSGTPYLNFTFKDEGDLSVINATIPTSTFNYYLGSGDEYRTLTYVNNSANYYYAFCLTPANQTLNIDYRIQYESTDYPQRVSDPIVGSFTNTTTNTTLYLLNTIDGIYVTFQVINIATQLISGVDVTATRTIESTDVIVGAGTTAASGSVTFWLNPDFVHEFSFIKTGYTTYTYSEAPTQASYTITLSSGATLVNSSFQGIDYSIVPRNTYLENDTIYTFGFNLTSSYWDVSEYGFSLRLSNGTEISGGSTGTEGTELTLAYNTTNQTIVYIDYYWIINGNTTTASTYWIVFNTDNTDWSIKTFFDDLDTYLDSEIFGLDTFGRYLITFLIIFMSIGIMSYKYGFTSPMSITTIAFGIIFFLDAVVGIIPEIRGIPYLLTFISALILVLTIFNEVRMR